MATQAIKVYGETGLASPEARIFALGADTLLHTVSLTEGTNNLGTYSGSFTGTLSGNHEINLLDGSGTLYTKAAYYFENSDGTYYPLTSAGAVDFPGLETSVLALSGSGAFVVTITVTDGASPLENVTVRMKADVSNNYVATSNASGVATFALDAATYTLSMSLSGYTHTPESVVISGAGNTAATMSAVSFSPSAVGNTTGYLYVYDETGVVESGVVVSCVVDAVRTSGTGVAFDKATRTATSDGTGLVQFTNLVPGATYLFRRGDFKTYSVLIPTGAGASYELPDMIGLE